MDGNAHKYSALARQQPSSESGPALLQEIRREVAAFRAHESERADTALQWALQTERLQAAAPQVSVEDGGDTVRDGVLSPGCVACKGGRWDCLFATMACNLSCDFCLTPCNVRDVGEDTSADGYWDALCDGYSLCDTVGVAFSGGEALLEAERLLQGLAQLRARRPDLHLWAYTNGLLLTEELLSRLVYAGLDELRFNMAATGYLHGQVTSMLAAAVKVVPTVTVEIPSIPEHAGELLKALPVWSGLGVRHLNLHELIYDRGSPSDSLNGLRKECRMPDGYQCAYNPQSWEVAASVFRDRQAGGLSIGVHFCSLQNKARQLRGRRLRAAPLTLQAHERLLDDGRAESACYFSDTKCTFVHPSGIEETMRGDVRWGVALVRRLLPLRVGRAGQWTDVEVIREWSG